uniref:F-box/LRR-repeat protein 15/At3g58940/PEG3-like LRR domain-containing protein n=1 Tax=Oryza barthii TaxID=65489 RepID=A0A0D3GPN9_9ORYZ
MNSLSHIDFQFTNGNTMMTDQANYMSYLLVISAFRFSSTLEVVSFSSCCLHDDMISQPLHFPKLRKLNLHSVNSSEDALHAMSARPLRASKSTTSLGCIIFASGGAAPRKTDVSFFGRWPRSFREMPSGNVAASVPTMKILVLQSTGPNLAAVVHLRYFPCLEKLYVRMNL